RVEVDLVLGALQALADLHADDVAHLLALGLHAAQRGRGRRGLLAASVDRLAGVLVDRLARQQRQRERRAEQDQGGGTLRNLHRVTPMRNMSAGEAGGATPRRSEDV